jgi:hypothetical protein
LNNLVRIHSNTHTASIICNRQKQKIEVLVSMSDLMLVASVPGSWVVSSSRTKSKSTPDAFHDALYCRTRIGKTHIYLHHLLRDCVEPGFQRDHKNGLTLDNGTENLQVITRQANTAKQRLSGKGYSNKPSATGVVGVFPGKTGTFRTKLEGRWSTFDSLAEAKQAYETNRKNLNFERTGRE